MRTLILGGARSGKSALAEALAAERQAQAGCEVVVLATAEAHDAEMRERIAQHRLRRPAHWRTVEAPLALAAALQHEAAPGRLLLVDCLTLWLTNLLLLSPWGESTQAAGWQWHPRAAAEREALLQALPGLPGEVLLIGNEVGHGIVPLGALNRVFVDESGRLHQQLAAQCDRVRFVMAGCAVSLKG